MNSKKKRFGKRQLIQRCERIGAELLPDRQSTKEGIRVFLVSYKGKLNGYRSLAELEHWLDLQH